MEKITNIEIPNKKITPLKKRNKDERIKNIFYKKLGLEIKSIAFNFIKESDFFDDNQSDRILEVYSIKLKNPEKFTVKKRDDLVEIQRKIFANTIFQIKQPK